MTKLFKFSSLLILVLSLFVLVGCAPKDPATAKANMEEKGYAVLVDETITPAALNLFGVTGAKAVFTAAKGATETEEASALFAVFFDTKDNAKASMAKLKEWAEKNDKASNFTQKGQWLVAGDDAAVKAFK